MYKTVATMHHPMPSSYSKSHIATCLVLVLLLVPIANAGKPPSNVPLVAGDRVLVTFQGGPKPTDQVKDKGLRLTTQVAESQAAAYRITDGTPLRKKIEQLSALPEVISAVPIGITVSTATSGTPNDQYFSDQYAWAKVKMPGLLGEQNSSAGINVVVMESDLDLTHPDLAANIATQRFNASSQTNVITDDPLCDGHGTHVAGVLGAVINNTIGVAGYGGLNMRMRMCSPFRRFTFGSISFCGAPWDLLAGCVEWARTQNAKLVTCSLGGAAVQGSEIFQTAVRLLARSGGLVVASAGNTFRNVDLDPFYPASFSEVFSVAATDEQDQIASFSNFGSAIDVAAPGVNIITADSLQFASNNPSVGYAFVEGTSFSVPITVGIMALLQARIKASSLNRFMRVEELRWLVRASVDKNDNLQNVKPVGSGGRINGQAAVTLLNRIIAGQAQFFQGDNPAPATKGRASCQILFFSGFGHSGDVYRHRVDWFDVNNRRVFVAQNLELSNSQLFNNRVRSFAVLCDCDFEGFDCNSQARGMRITLYTSPLPSTQADPSPSYTWNFAIRTSPRCQPGFCDIMYKRLPEPVVNNIEAFRFTFEPPFTQESPQNAQALSVNSVTTQVTGPPDVTGITPSYDPFVLRDKARGASVVRARRGSVPNRLVWVGNAPTLPFQAGKTPLLCDGVVCN